MRRLLFLLAGACLVGCYGRGGTGEFKLDSPAIENANFPNALFQTVGATLKPGNRVEPVDNGKVFDAAIQIIGSAKRSVHIETFIWTDSAVSNRIIDALAARTREGVACFILVDAIGSMKFNGLHARLEGLGCKVYIFRPLGGQDDIARDHRKMIIVDGRVGITGGFGIDDKWDGDGHSDDPPQWRDSNVRVEGPAVLDMQQAFAENWEEASGGLLPESDFPAPADAGPSRAVFVKSKENSIATDDDRLTQLLIASARKRVWIANAYFVPSTPIMALLTRKAHEGLDVRVMAAGDKTDTKPYLVSQRLRMDQLARDGVRVYEYQPAMMHAKTMVLDDDVAMVGSTNLDALSLNHMDEGALVVADPAFAAEEARRYQRDLDDCVERVPKKK